MQILDGLDAEAFRLPRSLTDRLPSVTRADFIIDSSAGAQHWSRAGSAAPAVTSARPRAACLVACVP
eukprot:11204857-Lingulodinium_polyedra.AAC.1